MLPRSSRDHSKTNYDMRNDLSWNPMIHPASPNSPPRFLSPRPRIEQKAELFAIIQTANFLKTRFDQGIVDSNFYIRRMKFFYTQIMDLQAELTASNTSLMEILDGLNLEGNIRSIITVISSTMDYQFNALAQQWELDPYQLAAASTQVTSDFITLLDYLHIAEDFNEGFVHELLENLITHLQQIHTFKPFSEHLLQLQEQLSHYFQDFELRSDSTVDQVRKCYSQIEEIIYTAFQDFKKYLHLSEEN